LHSFYPLFPPPQPKLPSTSTAQEAEAPLPLSLPHFHLATFTTVTPEVLLLPSVSSATASSSVGPFAKIVDGTVVVNPGAVATSGTAAAAGAGAGAINVAKLTVRPVEKRTLEGLVEEGDQPRESALWERCRVDLLSL
jgi:hypothetical protein